MSKSKLSYAIDDDLSTGDNLAVLRTAIEVLDADLAAILSPQLAALAEGENADISAIWNALFAATDVPTQDAVGDQT